MTAIEGAVTMRANAGKATVYRRWASKPELVLDAVLRMKDEAIDFDLLPDTGSLRGDLIALIQPKSVEQADRRLRIMAGLASVMAHDLGLAEAGSDAAIGPWVEVNRVLIRRAVERGEFSPDVDVETLSRIVPSMAGYRTLVERKSVDRQFFTTLIDHVLLPALRGTIDPDAPPGQSDRRT